MAISNSETCPDFWADVRVPEGALDRVVGGVAVEVCESHRHDPHGAPSY